MLWIIKSLLLTVFIIISSYFFGKIFTQKDCVYNLSIGFCVYIGILELLGNWVVALSERKIYFELIALAVYFVLILIVIKKKLYQGIYWKKLVNHNFLWVGITLILIVLVSVYFRSDADDSFYVSNAALFQNSIKLNPYDSSFGISELGTVPMYDFQIWESLVAVLSSLFQLEAVSVMHSFILPALLILSASSYMFLGGTLLKTNDVKKCTLFYAGVTLFHLFGGYAVYSEGSFLLSRLWQGKSIYLTIVLPVMTAIILRSIEKSNKYLWVMLSVCMLAGMALNPTSLYVLGFEMIFMVIAVAIINKRPKYVIHAVPAVVVAIFFTLMIYLRTRSFSVQIEAASKTYSSFVFDTFKAFLGNGKLYLLCYVLSVVIIVWKGSRAAKVYSVITPILLALFIWNPYFGRFIAQTVTKTPSYWRVFWLLPVGTSITYAGCVLYYNCHKKLNKLFVSIAVCMAIILPGNWMFSNTNGFSVATNCERIPEDSLRFGKIISTDTSKAIVLGEDEFSTTLRQKYVNIELIYSRYQYILDLFLYRGEKARADDRITMMDFANGKLTEFDGIDELLNNYNVDYVILGVDEVDEYNYLIETKQWVVNDSTKDNILLKKAE